MQIGIIGAGGIGRTLGRLWQQAGHQILLSWASTPERLQRAAAQIGEDVQAVTPAEAAAADVVLFSPRFEHIDAAARAAGSLTGRVVLDSTNPYNPTRDGMVDLGRQTSAEYVSSRLPGVHYVKAFNTLTVEFLTAAANRSADSQAAVFYATDDRRLMPLVDRLITDSGFASCYLGPLSASSLLDPPRRPGAVHGEEYRFLDARRVAVAVQRGDHHEAARLAATLKIDDNAGGL